jgi:hypothetical protein
MKTKIHNLKPYTPAQIESFRQRMEAYRQRAEEYDEPGAARQNLASAVLGFLIVVALVGAVIIHYWQASDKLLGLG